MLVKQLVEMHGGSIQARSAGVDQGSEFTVRLQAREPAPAAPRAEEKAAAPRAAGKRILVVDDNQDAATSLGMILKFLGNEVQIVHDGLAAVERASEFRPQTIFLDIGLPGIDGYTACRRIREQPGGDQIQIVALTGWGQEEDRQRTQQAGFDHHLIKPATPVDIKRVLQNPA